jgi:hypothetical protein
MSTSPVNPYDPNPFGDRQFATATVFPATRPGGLTAICVIAIVLGVMGFMSSGMKGVNLVFGKQFQKLVAGVSGTPNKEMAEAQEELNEAMWELSDRFLIPNILLASTQFALAIALTFGGLKAMKLQAIGRKVLVVAFSFVVVFEIAQLGLFAMIQIQMMPLMDIHMSRVLEAAPGNNPGSEKFAQSIAKYSLIAGFIMQGGWMLVKLVFLGIAIWYLRTQRIRFLFHGNASLDQAHPVANPDLA